MTRTERGRIRPEIELYIERYINVFYKRLGESSHLYIITYVAFTAKSTGNKTHKLDASVRGLYV